MRLKGTQHETVPGRFLRKHIKQEYSRDRQQMEYVERTFDRVNNEYHEVYYDPKTGDVVFEKHGQLTDQSLHGRRQQ